MSKRSKSPFNMVVFEEPRVDPDVERFKMAREIRREHWRNEFDMGFAPRGAVRNKWVDEKLREEGLL